MLCLFRKWWGSLEKTTKNRKFPLLGSELTYSLAKIDGKRRGKRRFLGLNPTGTHCHRLKVLFGVCESARKKTKIQAQDRLMYGLLIAACFDPLNIRPVTCWNLASLNANGMFSSKTTNDSFRCWRIYMLCDWFDLTHRENEKGLLKSKHDKLYTCAETKIIPDYPLLHRFTWWVEAKKLLDFKEKSMKSCMFQFPQLLEKLPIPNPPIAPSWIHM